VIEKMVQTFAEEALSFIPNCTAKSAKLPNSAGDQLSVVTNATKELSISFKQLSQEKDDVIKKSEQLLKKLTAKDRDLAKKDREIGYAGQISHKRQEELKSEASKTQTELEVAKRELEKAHKEPDRVRDEFSAKIQKLHDKVRGLEEYLQVKDSNISVLELDNEAMTKDLEASKAKVGRRDERLKKFTDEYKKLKDERDLLRLNLQTQSQVSERLRRDQANRITTEQALEQAAKLEKDLEKLNKDRLTDGNAISALQKELAEEREKSKRLGTKLASIIELIAKD
jgi:chromosome segregation ATPase